MVIPDMCQDLARLRKAAQRSQTSIAKRLGVDSARISRWENGEITPSKADVEKYLRAVKSKDAKQYSRFRKQKWRVIAKPSYWHPDRESLNTADRALAALDLFCRSNEIPPSLRGEIKMHTDALARSAQYLSTLDHKIAFVGEIGVGKSTAICALASLLLPEGETLQHRSALQTGQGRITLCEVHIMAGPAFGISIEPQSHEEIFTLVGDLCESFFPCEVSDGETKGVPEEIERALRNMAGLSKTKRAGTDGKPYLWDPVQDLIKQRPTVDEVRAEFLARMQLSRRTTRQLWPEDGSDVDLPWLRKTFGEVNSGKRLDVALPKRIDIILPRSVFDYIEGQPRYNITLIDTKGLDGSPVRRDISELLNDPRALTLLAADFKSAPGNGNQQLLKASAEIGLKVPIASRASIIVLAHPGQAIAMLQGTDGEPLGDQDGYLLKESEVRSALSKIGFGELPIIFFNAATDSQRDTARSLVDLISIMRQGERERMIQTCEAIRVLKSNFGQAVAVANQKQVAKRLAIEVEQHKRLRARVRQPYDHLLAVLKTSYRAQTVWAATRRNGSHWNLDVYYHLGAGAVLDAQLRCKKSLDDIDAVVQNMLNDDSLATSHEFLRELRSNLLYWQECFVQEVRTAGEEEFKPVLKEDNNLWSDCRRTWGTASGNYRGGIASIIQKWFEAPEREHLLAALEERVSAAWETQVIAQMRRICLSE